MNKDQLAAITADAKAQIAFHEEERKVLEVLKTNLVDGETGPADTLLALLAFLSDSKQYHITKGQEQLKQVLDFASKLP
jgi:hypothetical protein